MQTLGLFSLASRQAEWLAARQQVVAENISHADLPHYKARDIEPFKLLLARNRTSISITNERHLLPHSASDGIQRTGNNVALGAVDGAVSVEGELMKSAEVRNGLEINTAIVRAFHRMLLSVAKV